MALAVVGVLLAGGGGYALAAGNGKPLAAGRSSGNGPAPDGNGGGDQGGNAANPDGDAANPGTGIGTGTGGTGGKVRVPADRKLWRVQFPNSFLGMQHNEQITEGFGDALETMRVEQPNADIAMDVYTGGQFGERHATVLAASQGQPLTDAERKQALQEAWAPEPAYAATHTVFSGIQDVDPGPLGGEMQCAKSITKMDQPDVLGQQYSSGIRCAVVGVNTAIVYSESEVQSGMQIAKTAEDLRQFRAQAEVPR
ncbi:hypothetical protein ACIQGZ_25965 [Streptomyces sp. NPDC092296]|uniref:hypothetical protein n=1 Tax=Streptomyces sp. NPDC092296 TaxID=3366012 RepID=UPI0037F511AB